MKWLLFVCFFPLALAAQVEEKIILKTDATSTVEVKRQLLTEAVKNVVFRESDKSLPEKLNTLFEKHFADYKNRRISERFGPDKSKVPKADLEEFLAGVEKNRETEYLKFSRILTLVESYQVKSLFQSHNEWTAVLSLNLKPSRVERFKKRILDEQKKPFARLILVPEITFSGIKVSDLGLEKETSFTGPITKAWTNWLDENLPAEVQDTELCEQECLGFYRSWEETSQENISRMGAAEYHDCLFLKVVVNLRKIPGTSEGFEWEGREVLTQINDKTILFNHEIPQERKDWGALALKPMSSALASRVFKSGSSLFHLIGPALATKKQNTRAQRLVIKGYHQMSDVLSVMDLLKARGVSLGLSVKLDKLLQDHAEVICSYQGEEKSFTDLLSSLKELKSSKSYHLVSELDGATHVLKLKKE